MLHFYGYGLWSWLLTTLQHLRPFAIPDLRLVAATLSRPQGHGTWPFQGSGATAPEYYKLRNFTYRSSSSYNIDDATRILLLYTCRQPQLPHSPTSTSWSSWGWWLPSPDVPPGHGGRLRAAATAPSTCQVPIVHTGSLLYVYHSAEDRWRCYYIYRITLHIPHDEAVVSSQGTVPGERVQPASGIGPEPRWRRVGLIQRRLVHGRVD
jgi:hypothetical protein